MRIYLVIISFLVLTSCQYEEVADAGYPDQKVYLRAASLGIIRINNVSTAEPMRYEFDIVNEKMNIDLGVNRSGINNYGDVSVDIKLNLDTLALLSAANVLDGAVALPAERITLPAQVVVNSGSDTAPFRAVIDLDFLSQNITTKFAIAVTINTTQREITNQLRTALFLIEPQALLPVADFTSAVSTTNTLEYTFSNKSTNGLSYSWDFGDGTTSEEKNPVHVYAQAGSYTVTLRTIGIFGIEKSSVIGKKI